MTRPWHIHAPPYTHASGGVVVLHRLCHKLRQLGVDAAVGTIDLNPLWDTPHRPDPLPGSIVVYPEINAGNPLGAECVVRYVLYFPGALGGDVTYDASELVVTYRGVYCPGAPVVAISCIDETRFHSRDPKTCDVVYLHKGGAEGAPMPRGALVMTDGWPKHRALSAALLRSARRLYSYDVHTAVTLEARMCGAEVYTPRGGAWVLDDRTIEPLPPWDDLTETRRLVAMAKERFG